jgi:hypothetical protein
MFSVEQGILLIRVVAIISSAITLVFTCMTTGILLKLLFDTKESVDSSVLRIQAAVAAFSLAFCIGTAILLEVDSSELGCAIGIRLLLFFYAMAKTLSLFFLMRKALTVRLSGFAKRPYAIYTVCALLVLYFLLLLAVGVVIKPVVQINSSICIVTPILSLGFTGMTTVIEIIISTLCMYIFLRPLFEMTKLSESVGTEHVDRFKPVIKRNLIAGSMTILVNLAVQCIVSLGWLDARQNNDKGNYIAGMASLYVEMVLVTSCILYCTKPAWHFRHYVLIPSTRQKKSTETELK